MSTFGSLVLNPLSPLSILFVQLSWDTNVSLLGLPNKTNEQTVTTITKAWLPIHYFASHKVPQDCVVSEGALWDLSIVIIYTQHLTIHCWSRCQIGSSNCIWHTPKKKPFIADIAACTHRIIIYYYKVMNPELFSHKRIIAIHNCTGDSNVGRHHNTV